MTKLTVRALGVLLWSSAAFASEVALDGSRPDDVASAMPEDDECRGEAPGGEQCSMSALQVRGRRVGERANETSAAAAAAAEACETDPFARMAQTVAPACAKACPGACTAIAPVVAALQAGVRLGDGQGGMLCAAGLVCALEEGNTEACAPLLQEARAAFGADVALTLESACGASRVGAVPAGAGTSGVSAVETALTQRRSAGAATTSEERAQALEQALAGKEADARCAKAREGQNCVSSNQWIYCSAGKRLSQGTVDCESRVGHMSLCRTDGAGLAHDYCDDPFCRNGGATGGTGNYCHNDEIVFCKGKNPPQVIDSCPDRTWTDSSDKRHTETNHCIGNFPHPQCELSSSWSAGDGGSGGWPRRRRAFQWTTGNGHGDQDEDQDEDHY